MSYQVAVASSDGKVVNQHFGHATKFLIFEVEEELCQFKELLTTAPFCTQGEHIEEELQDAVEGLSGCRAVLASQIGKGAIEKLKSNNIEPFEIRDFIDEALKKLILYYKEQDALTEG